MLLDKKFLNTAAKALGISPNKLTENSTPETVEEWDSLSHWVLIGELENAYRIEFTMDEAADFKNLGDIYRMLIQKLQQPSP